jgi:hypothetical protein
VTLFDVSTHANYTTASGTAMSVTSLNVAEALMAVQKAPRVSIDSTNAYLNVAPGHLIVPVAKAATARTLIASQYDPAATAGTLTPNPWNGRLQVTADPLLDGTSTTAWYLAAPKGNSTIDTERRADGRGAGAVHVGRHYLQGAHRRGGQGARLAWHVQELWRLIAGDLLTRGIESWQTTSLTRMAPITSPT